MNDKLSCKYEFHNASPLFSETESSAYRRKFRAKMEKHYREFGLKNGKSINKMKDIRLDNE